MSILRLDNEGKYSRIGGTALGGATLLGLIRSTIREGDFKKIVNSIQDLKSSNLDMMLSTLSEFVDEESVENMVYTPFSKLKDFS